MKTIKQIEAGLMEYVSNDLIPMVIEQADKNKKGLLKWGIGGVVALTVNKAEKLVMQYMNHPVVQAMEIVDGEGNVDTAAVHEVLKAAQAQYGNATQAFPIIGDITFTAEDIDKLFEYIDRA